MKLSSVIGSVALFLICIILITAGIFWYWPEAAAHVTGFGPYDASGIALYCALLVIVIGSIAWAVERMFERAGKTGLHVRWHKNQQADKTDSLSEYHTDEGGHSLPQNYSPNTFTYAMAASGKVKFVSCWYRATVLTLRKLRRG